MGKKKSNSVNAARLLESKVAPVLEINFVDPLFSVAAHPSRPILACGLATGHVFCYSYDAEKLEDNAESLRESIRQEEKEAAKKSTSASSVRSVSQTKKKWWEVVADHSDVSEDSLTKTMWKTKRHKGSCRSVIFDPLESSAGESLFTVGTDHIIKKADTETGKVTGKVSVVKDFYEAKDAVTKLVHSAVSPFLVAGTENGHVLIYDSKNMGKNEIKYRVHQAHDDAINHILAMPALSAYHYLTLGSTTLSHIDIRKGIITQSDDQEDELLSMCFATDQINDNKNDTVLVSHGEGLVTIWKNSKNHWRDQLSRIKVNKGVSIDAIVPTMSCDTDEMASSVWCGDSEGLLHRINYKRGKVVETRAHSASTGKHGAVDEVGGLDIDFEYRLVSVGMESLKIWANRENEDEPIDSGSESESDEEDSGDSDISDSDEPTSDSDVSDVSDTDNEPNNGEPNASDVNSHEDGSDNSDIDEDAESSNQDIDMSNDEDSEDEDSSGTSAHAQPGIIRPKRAFATKTKRKLIKLDEKPEPQDAPEKKLKKKQLTSKQLRNIQQHEHGIRRFDGL